MKKLFLILALLVCLTTISNAQSTVPRFDTTRAGDNTGRVLTYRWYTMTDATGADSLSITPRAWLTTLPIALVDSFTLKQPSIVSSYAGDNIKIIATGASGTKIKFYGSYWKTIGTATLSTGGRAVIDLVFDGAYWVEANRTVQ